jgi:hypothetical protein
MLVAEEQWEEARHELQKRVVAIVGQGRLSSEQGEKLLGVVHDFVRGRRDRGRTPEVL